MRPDSRSTRLSFRHVVASFVILTSTLACTEAQSALTAGTNSDRSAARTTIQQAKAAALLVKNDFQRGLLLDEIGALQAAAGDTDGALATARAAYPHTTSTLTALGKAFIADEASLNAAAPNLNAGEASTIFYTVAVDQAAKGNLVKALALVKRIPAPEVRSSALREISQAQAAAGDDLGSRTSREEANKLYPAQRSSETDDVMSIAEGQLARGDSTAARSSIDRIGSKEMRAAALLSGAEELNKRGDSAAAQSWLAEGLKGLPQGRGAEFLRYMALPLQVRLGDTDSATKFADSTVGDMRVKAFGAIAVTCAEQKDHKGLAAAVAKIKALTAATSDDGDMTAFAAKLQLLNVSAALIENEQFAPANELLDFVQRNMDDISKLSLKRDLDLQRVVIAAKQDEFARGRELALTMQPDSVADVERGTALRTLAFEQTKSQGAADTQKWAASLRDSEDRAYALVGIAQATLGVGDIRLHYSAINIH